MILLATIGAASIARPATSQTIPWDQIMDRWDTINDNLQQPSRAASASEQTQASIQAHQGNVLVDPDPPSGRPGRTDHQKGGPKKGWQQLDYVWLNGKFLDPALQRPNIKQLCPNVTDAEATKYTSTC
jgi:hypothetical protein